MNEDALRYDRLDYVYDDGSDLEERRREQEKNWQEQFDRTISGEILEFWYMEERLYAVDRQEEIMTDVSEKAICISAFLQLQPDRIAVRLNTDETTAAQMKQLIPEGYCLLGDWNDVAAYDLNEDGKMDYVAALYPEDHPEERRYADFSSYEHSSEYYASEFWLLLSDAEQGYRPVRLSYSIEYPRDDALYLTDISFVGEGILRLEYFIGRSPWCTAVLLFEPRLDSRTGIYFYLLRSYFREFFGEMQIGDKESYGKLGIEIYYYGNFHYNEHAGSGTSDAPLRGDNTLDYSNVRYRCDDIWKEISLEITQQGVVVGLRTDLKHGTAYLTEYQIDKEHFMGTGLWYYLAPEWMQ